jgi:hypothetical protein
VLWWLLLDVPTWLADVTHCLPIVYGLVATSDAGLASTLLATHPFALAMTIAAAIIDKFDKYS